MRVNDEKVVVLEPITTRSLSLAFPLRTKNIIFTRPRAIGPQKSAAKLVKWCISTSSNN